MTAPTLDELRRLRDGLRGLFGPTRFAASALLDCEIARREAADQPSGDGLKILYEAGKLENDHLRSKLAAAEKERDDLAAMLKGAEYRRDKWEAGYNALRAEVDAVRQALIGLTIPRPDATAEIAALRESLSLSEKAHLDTKKERNQFREALRVERAACDEIRNIVGWTKDSQYRHRSGIHLLSGLERSWCARHDSRRAAEKAKP